MGGVIYPKSPVFTWAEDLRLKAVIEDEGVFESKAINILPCLQELEELYADKKASPLDVDENGWTLLHIVGGFLKSLPPEAQVYLLEKLVTLGVPINELNFAEETFLDVIVEGAFPSVFDATRRCSEGGAEFYNPTVQLALEGLENQPAQFLKIDDFADVYECGPLSRAVLAKSPVRASEIISSNADAIDEINLLGQTPLHLAMDWPEGVKLLIDAGADVDVVDQFGQLPVSWACRTRTLMAVKLFLDTDCVFWREVATGATPTHMESVFQDAILCRDDRIIDLVIENLRERRKRLKAITKANSINVSKGKLLDFECFDIITELRKISPTLVPKSLAVPYKTTVYHFDKPIPLTVLRKLEKAGFLDQFKEDCRGLTPQAIMASSIKYEDNWMDSCEYYFSRLEYSPTNSTLAASKEGGSIRWSAFQLFAYCFACLRVKRKDNDSRALVGLGRILGIMQRFQQLESLQDQTHYQCSCPCSVEGFGCSPTSIFLRTTLHCYVEQGRDLTPKEVQVFLRDIYATRDRYLKSPFQISRTTFLMLRLICMELLEIPHTCCTVRQFEPYTICTSSILHRRVDDSEVEALNAEYEPVVSRLNAMLSSVCLSCGWIVPPFWYVWWFLCDNFWTLPTDNTLSEEEIRGIRSIGVIIENPKDETHLYDRELGLRTTTAPSNNFPSYVPSKYTCIHRKISYEWQLRRGWDDSLETFSAHAMQCLYQWKGDLSNRNSSGTGDA